MRKSMVTLLVMSMLLLPASGWRSTAAAQQQDTSVPSASSSSNQSSVQPQTSQPTYRQSRASRRSYARETRRNHRHHITKGEIAFMAGIAGTSMGIGALAGGARGLAIGSIVGGWGAYVGHRLWNKIKG